MGCASFILKSHSSFNFALAAEFRIEIWKQDSWTGHALVVQFCMIFAHEHYSMCLALVYLVGLANCIVNFLDVSKLYVYN